MTIIVVLIIVIAFVYGQHRYCFYHWDEELNIDIGFSTDMVGVGDKFEIIESVSNKKRLPLPILRIKYQTGRDLVATALRAEKTNSVSDKFYYSDVVAMKSYEEVEKRLECVCKKRGIYTIDQLYVTTHDLMLIGRFYDVQKVSSSILVYPERADNEQMKLTYNILNGDIVSKIQYLEDPFEFKGIREYMPGDGLRKINFKASARSSDLMVNLFNQTMTKAVCVIVDSANNHNYTNSVLQEESFSLAKTICEDLLMDGYDVSFVTNGRDYFNDEEIRVNSGSGIKHLSAIHEAMAIIDLNLETKDFESSDVIKDTLLADVFCIIISSNQNEEVVKSIKDRISKGKETMWIVPTDRSTEYIVPSSLQEYTREWNKYGR